MTSVNLPDMVRIFKEHGLVPVPLDLDPRTMAPVSVEKFKELISPKVRRRHRLTFQTKVFLAAYIFGVRFDPSPYADICEERGIEMLEDYA